MDRYIHKIKTFKINRSLNDNIMDEMLLEAGTYETFTGIYQKRNLNTNHPFIHPLHEHATLKAQIRRYISRNGNWIPLAISILSLFISAISLFK